MGKDRGRGQRGRLQRKYLELFWNHHQVLSHKVQLQSGVRRRGAKGHVTGGGRAGGRGAAVTSREEAERRRDEAVSARLKTWPE